MAGRDFFQEAVAILKSAMQSDQQFKRGRSESGAEAIVLYTRGLDLLRVAVTSDRHSSVRPQLEKKVQEVEKKLRALTTRVDQAAVDVARDELHDEVTTPAPRSTSVSGSTSSVVHSGSADASGVGAQIPRSSGAVSSVPGASEARSPLSATTTPRSSPPPDTSSAPSSIGSVRRSALLEASAARQGLFETSSYSPPERNAASPASGRTVTPPPPASNANASWIVHQHPMPTAMQVRR